MFYKKLLAVSDFQRHILKNKTASSITYSHKSTQTDPTHHDIEVQCDDIHTCKSYDNPSSYIYVNDSSENPKPKVLTTIVESPRVSIDQTHNNNNSSQTVRMRQSAPRILETNYSKNFTRTTSTSNNNPYRIAPINTIDRKDYLPGPPPVDNHKIMTNKIRKQKRKVTTITDLLRKIPALSHLPDHKFKELGRHYTKIVNYPKKSVIYHVNDLADCLYFIKNGVVNLQNEQGQTLGSRSKGQFFGQEGLTALNNRRFDTVTVVSENGCTLYCVSNAALFDDDTFVMSHVGTVFSSIDSHSYAENGNYVSGKPRNNNNHHHNNYYATGMTGSLRDEDFNGDRRLQKIAGRFQKSDNYSKSLGSRSKSYNSFGSPFQGIV